MKNDALRIKRTSEGSPDIAQTFIGDDSDRFNTSYNQTFASVKLKENRKAADTLKSLDINMQKEAVSLLNL